MHRSPTSGREDQHRILFLGEDPSLPIDDFDSAHRPSVCDDMTTKRSWGRGPASGETPGKRSCYFVCDTGSQEDLAQLLLLPVIHSRVSLSPVSLPLFILIQALSHLVASPFLPC